MTELAGCQSLRTKESWLFNNWNELKELFSVGRQQDSPSDSTLGRVLRGINVTLLQTLVSDTIRKLFFLNIQKEKVVHYALDGKSRRGVTSELTGRTEIDLTLFHTASASIVNKLTIPDKLGESTAAPTLIAETFKSSFQNGVVTFDCAMTTPSVTKAVIASGNEYLGGLKGFNGKVYEIAQSYDWGSVESCVFDSNKSHGREEVREVKIIEITKLTKKEKSRFLKYKNCGIIIQLFRKRLLHSKGTSSEETAFYVGSSGLIDLKPQEIYKLQRDHWLLENRGNWVRDVVMQEDNCKTKSKNASRCLGAFRDLVLYITFNDGNKKMKDYIINFSQKPMNFLSKLRSLETYEILENLKFT